jgi:hypothetical protein
VLADQLLCALAYGALRVLGPERARRGVGRLGALLPKLDVEQARRRHASLRRGTCLSRAIAIAARVPGARVVIGVGPGVPLEAHAWVVAGEERIGETMGLSEMARF